MWTFQSTPPSRAVTVNAVRNLYADGISIHTALAGSDIIQRDETIY